MKQYFLLCYVILSLCALTLEAQDLSYPNYNIGNPSFQEIWVDPTSGSDSNSGSTKQNALKTLNAAWQKIPQGVTLTSAYKILLMPGSFPESSIPNYWEDRHGTQANPILIQSADGPGTVTLQGDINAFNIDYLYLVGFSIIPEPAGDAFHCEECDYLLISGMILSGGNKIAHETIKINQSRNIYIEDSDISGADDNAIDFVSVQYGHIVRNKIHAADDWCAYVKGGSSQILVEGNTIYDCGTGGFTAGQGSGLEFMTSPWLHYEAYDIKVINNIVYRTNGAGLGVNGGYNILLAHNTLYKVGRNSHALEIVYGYRSCDGNVAKCNSYLGEGGWGTNVTGTEGEPIPNKNVFVYNNLIYNPEGFESQSSHFAIYGPRTPAGGTNLPPQVTTDANVQIKGNLLWNGTSSLPLGVEDASQGCQPSNPTCNATLLAGDNYVNTQQPIFIDPENGDFRSASTSPIETLTPRSIPSFSGGDRQSTPLAAAGNLTNTVERDFSNTLRASRDRIGANAGSLRSLTSADGYLPWNSYLEMVNIVELVNKGSGTISVKLTVYDTLGHAISQVPISLASHAQQDVILNLLSGFPSNSYGLVAIDCASQDMDARLSVYRSTRGTSDFDFAYASSLLEPVTGATNVSFNTMQPSGNLSDSSLVVANWLSITNPDPSASHSFSILRYDESGTQIVSKRVTVSPFGRVDIEGGHESPGRLRIGLNRIVPDDVNSPYFANIVRYGLDNGAPREFQFAYPIIADSGNDAIQYVPISNGGGAQNWVEIVNTSDSLVNVSAQVYNSIGQISGAPVNIGISAHSQYHLNASQSLASGASGVLKISSDVLGSIVAHSLYYFFKTNRSISSMYGIKALASNAGYSTGSYNLYLGMANWLKIANISQDTKTATLRLYRGTTTLSEQSFSIPSLSTMELPLHETSRFGTSSNTYGLVEVVGEGLSSHVLRIRPSGNEINFIFPTEIR